MIEIESIKSDIINALKDKHYVNPGFDNNYILVSSEDGKKLFQVIVREVEWNEI